MSREVDRDHPKSQDDLLYLAQRDMLTEEWVEKLGGVEGVSALLRGEKVVRFKSSKKADADAEVEEDESDSDES